MPEEALARLEQKGWMATADLARAESIKPQSMGAILPGLEQDGLVQHRPHRADGRQVPFSQTTLCDEARRKRSTAKQGWLLAAVAKLDPTKLQTLICAAATIMHMGDSWCPRPTQIYQRNAHDRDHRLQDRAHRHRLRLVFH